MATEIAYMQLVLLLNLFQHDIDSLNCVHCPLLTYQYRRIYANWIYMTVTISDMLL